MALFKHATLPLNIFIHSREMIPILSRSKRSKRHLTCTNFLPIFRRCLSILLNTCVNGIYNSIPHASRTHETIIESTHTVYCPPPNIVPIHRPSKSWLHWALLKPWNLSVCVYDTARYVSPFKRQTRVWQSWIKYITVPNRLDLLLFSNAPLHFMVEQGRLKSKYSLLSIIKFLHDFYNLFNFIEVNIEEKNATIFEIMQLHKTWCNFCIGKFIQHRYFSVYP